MTTRARWLCALVLLVLLAAIGPAAATTVRVAYFPNLTHMQALVGMADGTFARALGKGVRIEPYPFNAGPAEIEALYAGKIDIGYIGPSPAINGYIRSRGTALRVVAGAASGGSVLVARRGTTIRAVADLNGKKVAVPQFGNTQDVMLRLLLRKHKLASADRGGRVTVIGMENPDILSAFLRQEMDAACVPEPWGSRLMKEADARLVLDERRVWAEPGRYSVACVIVSTAFLKQHRDLLEKWLRAHLALTDRLSKRRPADLRLANAEIKRLTGKALPADILVTAASRIGFTADPLAPSLGTFARAASELGYLRGKVDIRGLVDPAPLAAARRKP